jgi:hypothetical protein
MQEQTTLSWDEAEKKDELNSKYFSAGSNMKYTLTFSATPVEDSDSFDKKCITGRLVKKMMPVWENGKKTDKMEEKVILQMVISSMDGEPCQKIWNIKSAKMRAQFRTYAENNLLTAKKFVVVVKGELVKGDYSVVALDLPPKN